MPNLFPTDLEEDIVQAGAEQEEPEFGRSWKFDFDKGEFVTSPVGKVEEADPLEAWVEWCKKAVNTARYRYLAYSEDHGQEFDELIALNLTREANESEIQRMVTECLMVNPRTDRVENFQFNWEKDKVYFSFDIYNTLEENIHLEDSVVMS
ncbi:DUF2634 domain-containing protein [Virgibacillus halodenitrificans]|uniref:DUF2634 domain-containing protein n=1 Tax=Virgibacillus halodenitrificans TaxID=1482 RepID=UPI0013722C8E|nr:DUF2634 domain-containing protein [Virgibacillus halodenitrificans]MYL45062.1 DUF2634 domain-containing protein [Virgibacillus halodenitrificans]